MNNGHISSSEALPFPRARSGLNEEAFVTEHHVATNWIQAQEQALSEVFLAEGRKELPVDDYVQWRRQQQLRLGESRRAWTDALAEAGWRTNRTWAYLRPDLLDEYDVEHAENPPGLPFEEKVTSTLSVWWRCGRDEDHRWRTSVNNRHAVGTGCPRCAKKGVSRREQEIFVALRERYASLESPASVPRCRNSSGGRRIRAWRVDMLLPGTPAVVVEYDGAYWHKGRMQADSDKTADLTASGCVVIRVRESPLPPITPNDIVCAQGLPAHEVAELVHQRISKLVPDSPPSERASTSSEALHLTEQLGLFTGDPAADSDATATRASAPAVPGAHAKAVTAALVRDMLLAVHETQVRQDWVLGTQQEIDLIVPHALHEMKYGLGRVQSLARAAVHVLRQASAFRGKTHMPVAISVYRDAWPVVSHPSWPGPLCRDVPDLR
ncbi:zinc-ribbon domain-containing protein [Streptomyces sp. NPDC058195]|uniref:zinc-ribbon domain-containing protein n=1 Tax=Streptomyces sp. NPDC058195 TaxID=3346375 RepID=UPI0036E2D4D6